MRPAAGNGPEGTNAADAVYKGVALNCDGQVTFDRPLNRFGDRSCGTIEGRGRIELEVDPAFPWPVMSASSLDALELALHHPSQQMTCTVEPCIQKATGLINREGIGLSDLNPVKA
jgi:hypothetical protein